MVGYGCSGFVFSGFPLGIYAFFLGWPFSRLDIVQFFATGVYYMGRGGVRSMRSSGYPYLMERYLSKCFPGHSLLSGKPVLTCHLSQCVLQHRSTHQFLIDSHKPVDFCFLCLNGEFMGGLWGVKQCCGQSFGSAFPTHDHTLMGEHI